MYDGIHTAFDVMKEFLIIGAELEPQYGMPFALNLYNHYRNHALGWYMHMNGIKVIPSVKHIIPFLPAIISAPGVDARRRFFKDLQIFSLYLQF